MRTLLLTLLIGGMVCLQILFCKRENKWLGLVLPSISFLISSFFPLTMIVPSSGITVGYVMYMIVTWLLYNIPTFILVLIYVACQVKQRRNKQLEKMSIQDLD